MIAEIAREYRKGRILNIGTTNLDAGRPVIWNIGRIADSGDPRAGDLIRQVLLASASIPGVFPPAYIQVQTPSGKTYDEMHVDGGTSAQMFLYPTHTQLRGTEGTAGHQGHTHRPMLFATPVSSRHMTQCKAQVTRHRGQIRGLAHSHPGHRRCLPYCGDHSPATALPWN